MGIKIEFLLAPAWCRRFCVFLNRNILIYQSQSDKICKMQKMLGGWSSLGRSAGSFIEQRLAGWQSSLASLDRLAV